MKKANKINAACILSAAFLTASTSLIRCTKDKTPVPVEPCDPSKIYFQRDVFPILNSNCAKSGCHNSVSRAEGIDLSNYRGALSIVKPGKPSSSKLMDVLESSGEELMPPPPNSPLTTDQKAILSRWIADGALNSSCTMDTSSCSVQSSSYSKDVRAILQDNCLGCHSGGSPGGGIDLSAFQNVQSTALSGRLYKSVSQDGPAVPMPPSGRLNNCDIRKIKLWAEAGAPNN